MLTMTVETINEAVATRYVATMATNRVKRPRRVRRYAQDMLNGKWILTHQGIAFDEQGCLRDGQHRLYAVIEAKVSVQMAVFRGITEQAVMCLDQGLGRAVCDAMLLSGGGEYTTRFIAVAKCLMTAPSMDVSKYESPAMVQEVIGVYGDAIRWAMENLKESHGCGISRSVRACVARAWLHENESARLAEFCRALTSCVVDDNNADLAAITLHKYLMRTTRNTQQDEEDRYRKTQSMLRAFLDRIPATKAYGTDKDLFPI